MTHGGSLRIFARHTEDNAKSLTERVDKFRRLEMQNGLDDLKTYHKYSEKVRKTKRSILDLRKQNQII